MPPPEERNRLWMVEAEISPEMIKRKKKKKKRKKEVRPAEEAVDPQAYCQREFGRSSVPRLPKLPCHPSLEQHTQFLLRLHKLALPLLVLWLVLVLSFGVELTPVCFIFLSPCHSSSMRCFNKRMPLKGSVQFILTGVSFLWARVSFL